MYFIKLLLSVVVLTGSFVNSSIYAEKTKVVTQEKKDKNLFESIKKMYSEFVDLIKDGTKTNNMKEFFNKYFDEKDITRTFIGSTKKDEKLIDTFIDYCAHLLKGDVIKQIKDYNISDDFSQINKKRTITIQCKLKNNNNEIVDMSVIVLSKNKKIKDLIFMKQITLVKGAKSIVNNYCEKNKKILKKMKAKERSEIFQTALKEYISGSAN